MEKLIIIGFLSVIFLSPSYATTLIQALDMAYKDNPKLNAERENLIISKEEINEAKSDFLPSITISGYVSDENTTKLTNRSGADVQSTDVDPSQESILIEQTLFQGLGGMANLEKNTIGLELSKLKLKKVEQEILLEAIEAYTNLVVSKKKVEINISNVNLLERQVENDKNRLERSEINLTDLAQSEASLAGANARLIEARNHLITGKLNYEKTIGVINNYENLNETYVFNYELPRSLALASKIAKKENPESVFQGEKTKGTKIRKGPDWRISENRGLGLGLSFSGLNGIVTYYDYNLDDNQQLHYSLELTGPQVGSTFKALRLTEESTDMQSIAKSGSDNSLEINRTLVSATYRWFVDGSVVWGITDGFFYGAGGGFGYATLKYQGKDASATAIISGDTEAFNSTATDYYHSANALGLFAVLDAGWQGLENYYFQISFQPSIYFYYNDNFEESSIPVNPDQRSTVVDRWSKAKDLTRLLLGFGIFF